MNKKQEKTMSEIHSMLRHLVIKELVSHRNRTLKEGGNFIDEDIKWQMVRERLGLNELLPDISDVIGTKIVIHGGLELPDFKPKEKVSLGEILGKVGVFEDKKSGVGGEDE